MAYQPEFSPKAQPGVEESNRQLHRHLIQNSSHSICSHSPGGSPGGHADFDVQARLKDPLIPSFSPKSLVS